MEDSPGSGTYTLCSVSSYDPAAQELILNISGTQDETLRFRY